MKKDSSPCVLVCVSDMVNSDRLIRSGKDWAQGLGIALRVISVQPKSAFQGNTGGDLEILFRAVCEAGGDMTVYYDDRGGDIVLQYIRRNPISAVVLGAPGPHSNALALRLEVEHPALPIRQVSEAPETRFIAVRTGYPVFSLWNTRAPEFAINAHE